MAGTNETPGGKAVEAALRELEMARELEAVKNQLSAIIADRNSDAVDAHLARLTPSTAMLKLWISESPLPDDVPDETEDGPW